MKGQSEKQFAIYSRKSKFTGKGESIENQIELCRSYIASCYSTKAAQNALIYEDEGFSGGTLDRPQFKKMMADSHNIALDAIVVYRLDRISRNIGDFAKLIEDLGNRNIGFISIREQFDTASPMGRAMMYIASVFSQLERETIAERIRDNMHELAKTGRWLGGTTPTGYESESISNVTVDGKVRKACKLKIIQEEISLVQLIFEKFLETGSLTKVDAFLLEKRYTTKRGKNFTRFAIKGILTNPVYMIADEAAYGYLTENHVDLFAEKTDFDDSSWKAPDQAQSYGASPWGTSVTLRGGGSRAATVLRKEFTVGKTVQTLVGNRNHAHIRLYSTEREISRLCLSIRKAIEKSGLADVRQPHNTTLKCHISLLFLFC